MDPYLEDLSVPRYILPGGWDPAYEGALLGRIETPTLLARPQTPTGELKFTPKDYTSSFQTPSKEVVERQASESTKREHELRLSSDAATDCERRFGPGRARGALTNDLLECALSTPVEVLYDSKHVGPEWPQPIIGQSV